jgi:hypothetical protein
MKTHCRRQEIRYDELQEEGKRVGDIQGQARRALSASDVEARSMCLRLWVGCNGVREITLYEYQGLS